MLAPRKVMFYVGSMDGGGAERQAIEVLKRLDRQKFLPSLYLDHRRGPLLDEVPADVEIHSFWDEFAGTLSAKWHHFRGSTSQKRYQHLARVLREEQVDLLYSQTHLATLNAAGACRIRPTSHISACVCDPLEEVRLYSQQSFDSACQETRDAFESADRVVAISSGIRERLICDLGVRRDKIDLHYYMVDPEYAVRQSNQAAPEFAADRFHLLTVARLSDEKRHKDILDAVASLVNEHNQQDLLWHILGTGLLEEKLKAEVVQRKLQEFVDFAGFQSNPYPYYRNADLFCLASKHEAFGLVIAEALACGLPVLATDCPSGPREILGDGRFGHLVPVQNSAALVESILDYRSNHSEWKAKTLAGQKFVGQSFSFTQGLPRLESLFCEVIQSSMPVT